MVEGTKANNAVVALVSMYGDELASKSAELESLRGKLAAANEETNRSRNRAKGLVDVLKSGAEHVRKLSRSLVDLGAATAPSVVESTEWATFVENLSRAYTSGVGDASQTVGFAESPSGGRRG